MSSLPTSIDRRYFRRAFSLIEVALSIGITSVTLLTVLSLLTVAEQSTLESINHTRAAQTVRNAFESYKATAVPEDDLVRCFFDGELRKLGSEITGDAVFELKLSDQTDSLGSSFPGCRLLNAEFRSPAHAPSGKQRVLQFTTLIRETP